MRTSIGSWCLPVLALLVIGCSRGEGPAPTAPPAVEPQSAAQQQEALKRADRTVKELEALQGRLADLEEKASRVDKLERELAIARSTINEIERRPLPPAAPYAEAQGGAQAAGRLTSPPVDGEDEEAQQAAQAGSGTAGGEAAAAGEEGSGEEQAGVTAEGSDGGAAGAALPALPVDGEAAGEPATPGVEGEQPALPVGNVELVNMKFSHEIDRQSRLVVEERTTFKSSENRVYCWLVFSNLAPDETAVKLSWIHEGKSHSVIDLKVGKQTSHWRTWAYIRPNLKGAWQVAIHDLSGRQVATGSFTVE